MSQLLYIEASPRRETSHSSRLADGFLDALSSQDSNLTIDRLNVWSESLPRFDGEILASKYTLMRGEDLVPEQANAWKAITAVIDRFKAADRYVIATPMWNFGVPYPLKHLIDVIAQPGYTFAAKPDAGLDEWGLLTNKRAVVISAQGAAYPADSPFADWDFQVRYLAKILSFIGVTDTEFVTLEMTTADPDGVPAREAALRDALAALATTFLPSTAES